MATARITPKIIHAGEYAILKKPVTERYISPNAETCCIVVLESESHFAIAHIDSPYAISSFFTEELFSQLGENIQARIVGGDVYLGLGLSKPVAYNGESDQEFLKKQEEAQDDADKESSRTILEPIFMALNEKRIPYKHEHYSYNPTIIVNLLCMLATATVYLLTRIMTNQNPFILKAIIGTVATLTYYWQMSKGHYTVELSQGDDIAIFKNKPPNPAELFKDEAQVERLKARVGRNPRTCEPREQEKLSLFWVHRETQQNDDDTATHTSAAAATRQSANA